MMANLKKVLKVVSTERYLEILYTFLIVGVILSKILVETGT